MMVMVSSMVSVELRHDDALWKQIIHQSWSSTQRSVSLVASYKEERPWNIVVRLVNRSRKAAYRSIKTIEYWDSQFKLEDQLHEWLAPYSSFREHFLARVPSRSSRVLIIGCGLSHVPASLWEDGYRHIVSTDISST
jgi:hypothetical protein